MRTFSGVGSRLVASTGRVRQHPDVGRFDAFAHRHRARVGLVGNAAEAAWHHAPAVGRRGGVDAQHERARDEPAVLPARRRRKAHDVLADVIDAARLDRGAKRRALVGLEFAADDARRPVEAGRGDRRRRRRSKRSRARRARARARSGWPHHQVAMFGITRSSPMQAAGEGGQERQQRARFDAGPSPACSRPRRRRRGSRRSGRARRCARRR